MKKAVIVFQKAAVPGKVKTRLAQRVGDAQATKVYRYLVAHTHRQLEKIDADIYIFFAGDIDDQYYASPRYHIRQQCEGDLGLRMSTAFAEVFDIGYNQALIIGTDCYEMKSSILVDAFQALNGDDMVIGPAKDGGYYLLGLPKPIPELFNGIAWSTSTVFNHTLDIAATLGVSVHELPALNDVDRYEDLGELSNLLGVIPLD
jgi:uncharacterized protein